MSSPASRHDSRAASPPEVGVPNRWLALVVLSLAQLMDIVDNTIVNIALPSAQRELGFSLADRQWVITWYALAFGSLLLVGGRLADLFGRKRMFMIGVGGFAVASAIGGAAPGIAVLLVARVAQGAFAAMLAPAALSLLSVIFLGDSSGACSPMRCRGGGASTSTSSSRSWPSPAPSRTSATGTTRNGSGSTS